jgi:dihydrofolate synthase/folylpolyglutamate synthase
MGGRLDATNVVEPRISIITDISLDHQKFLGNTIAEIAREKAGIIRSGGVVVTLPQQPQANDVIGNAILDLGARGVNAVPFVPPVSPASEKYLTEKPASLSAKDAKSAKKYFSRYPLQVMGKEILVETPLVGRHQLRNVALAIAAAEQLSQQGFPVTPEAIERGIRETHWPGRFQVIPARDGLPEVVFDVAHNPDGAWALRSTLSAVYEDRPFTLIFGAMQDKDVRQVTEILFSIAEHVIATRADNPRAASPEQIRGASARLSVEIEDAASVSSALAHAKTLAGADGLIVVTGSIYLVGEAMRELGVRP